MTENPKQGNMSSDYLMPNYVSDQVNESGKYSDDDSFVLDIRGISPLAEKDINTNSRLITRNISSFNRGGEKKINQGKASVLQTLPTTATLQGGSTPEHPGIGSIDPQVHRHHQITINNANSTTAESKRGVKRFDFKHSSRTWAIDPRRILLFFATLSSMGTIILIYFTLSMGKLNMDDNLN